MELINKKKSAYQERPIKIVQFGEGNFLRAFVDYMIDIANEQNDFNGNIVLVKPIEQGSIEQFKQQECQYTVQIQGLIHREQYVETRKITCIEDIVSPFEDYDKYIELATLESLRFIVSNTTEAGIIYSEKDKFEEKLNISFPGKLTQFLWKRFQYFQGEAEKGLIIFPVELIDDNGTELKQCVNQYIDLWKLPTSFKRWIDTACIFANTLVDRIVTGYPNEEASSLCKEWGYQDNLIVAAEPFALWVIESDKDISKELPLDVAMREKTGMDVVFTKDHKPYKQRKVRILNGAHTSFVLASYLKGNNTVRESMEDNLIREFMLATIYDEVLPTLDLNINELKGFAESVVDRFNNPFIHHFLLSISLNSVSKWRARCLPSMLKYTEMFEALPRRLTFSIAALLSFYSGEKQLDKDLVGYRNSEKYIIQDDEAVINFFQEISQKSSNDFVEAYLSNKEFHGQDLTEVKGLKEQVITYLDDIKVLGISNTLIKHFSGGLE